MTRRLSDRRPGPAAVVILLSLLVASSAGAQAPADIFDDARLHDVHLRVSARDWTALTTNLDDDAFYPADITWNGVTARNVGLRGRGLGSRTVSKPNLRVDVNRYITDQRFLGLSALNLDNQYSDASQMRDALAMKVFERLGGPAPRQAHARLFVNGAFAGIYALVEPVDRRFIARVYGDREADAEAGGYLYEYRWVSEYDFSWMGTDLTAYAARFMAQTRDTDAIASVYGPIEHLIRAVNDTPRDRFVTEVGALLDLPAVVRFVAIQNCMSELDGVAGYDGTNNFYIYRFRDGRPAVLLPWDADHSLSSPDMPIDYQLRANVLTRRIMEVPQLARAYVATVAECAALLAQPVAGDARGWLQQEVARRASLITEAVAADRFALFTFDEYVEEVNRLLDFARLRPEYLQCQAQEWAREGRFGQSCPVPPSPTPTPGLSDR